MTILFLYLLDQSASAFIKMGKIHRKGVLGTTKLLVTSFAATISLASSAAISHSSRNLTLSMPDGHQCTDNTAWIGSGSTNVDCIGAVQLLYHREVKHWKDQDFEFISEKVEGRSIPWQRTPRKYTVGNFSRLYTLREDQVSDQSAGTCTVAIVMLNFFADGELPGIDGGPFASRDVTSFNEIWQAASQIEAMCLLHSGKPGWASQGKRFMRENVWKNFAVEVSQITHCFWYDDVSEANES